MKRIVLDTNCLIASLPSKSIFHRVWEGFIKEEYTLCVSNEILMEYEEIIAQKINSVFANNVIKTILNKRNVIKTDPRFNFHLIKQDPDDNKFVDCAICSNASYLVSEDAHYRVLRMIDFPSVQLVTIREFIMTLQSYENDIQS